MITKQEIKEKINKLNFEIEKEIKIKEFSFMLNNNIIKYTDEIHYLQKLCERTEHNFDNGDNCTFCGKKKEKK